MELIPQSWKTKWNLGQTKPKAAVENIKIELKKRGVTQDLRTLLEMEKWELMANRISKK